MNRLFYALSHSKVRFTYILLFGLFLNAIFAAADPLIMKLLIDEGLMKRNFELFAVFATIVVVFGAGMRGLFLVYELLAQRLKNNVAESLTLRMLKSYFEIPYERITRSDSGYFISRMYDEPAKVAEGVVTTVIGLLGSLVTFAAACAVSLYLSWRITLILSAVVPALYFLASRFSPAIKAASERENEEEARLREVLGRSVDSYKTVKLFGLYPSVYNRVVRHLELYLGVFYGRFKTSLNYQTLSAIVLSFAEILVLIAAGWEVVSGNLTIGGLFAFMTAFWKLIEGAKAVVSQVPELSRLSGSIDRLMEFEVHAARIEGGDTPQIALDNVGFRYNSRSIFDGLNLKIEPGERVLIVGPNGSGKTTLGHLLAGFLSPTEGVVTTPGLERISATLSPFHFPPGNVKDNVNYENLTAEKVALFWQIVRALGLEGRIEADAESELSEGEKKKCQLLMALLKDAEIYIFDEPLANVDVESRDIVVRTQLEFTRGKTVISIMHGDEKYHSLFDRVVALDGRALEVVNA